MVPPPEIPTDVPEEWVTLVAPGEQASFLRDNWGCEVVTVIRFMYTRRGVFYELEHPDPTVRWHVPRDRVQPIPGQTKLIRYNLDSGETEPLG